MPHNDFSMDLQKRRVVLLMLIFMLLVILIHTKTLQRFSLFEELVGDTENMMQYPGPYYFENMANVQKERQSNANETCNQLNFNISLLDILFFNGSRKEKLEFSSRSSDLNGYYMRQNYSSLFEQFLYNDDYKVVYCTVSEVACSKWMKVFSVMSGKINTNDLLVDRASNNSADVHLKRMSRLQPADIWRRLQPASGYFKFFFTRDPLERLYSVFSSELQRKHLFSGEKNGSKGNDKLKVDREFNELTNWTSAAITFEDFVKFITDEEIVEEREALMNDILRPVGQSCMPCFIRYHFIGKYETLEADTFSILHKFNLTHLTFKGADLEKPHEKRTNNMFEHFYRNLSMERLMDLLSIYRIDYKMFYPNFRKFSDLVGNGSHNNNESSRTQSYISLNSNHDVDENVSMKNNNNGGYANTATVHDKLAIKSRNTLKRVALTNITHVHKEDEIS